MKQLNALNTALSNLPLLIPAVPVATVYGMAIHNKLGLPFWPSVMVAFCGAIGFELIGLRSGKGFLKAIKLKQWQLSAFYSAALVAYGVMGVIEAGGEWAIIMIIATLGYFVLGASQFLDEESQEKRADKENSLQARTAVRLAEIEANKQVEIAKIAPVQNVAPAIAEQQNTVAPQKRDNYTAIVQLYSQGEKQADIARQLKVDPSTVTRAIQKYNRISAD